MIATVSGLPTIFHLGRSTVFFCDGMLVVLSDQGVSAEYLCRRNRAGITVPRYLAITLLRAK